jgi:N-acetyl-gamma-glutamyl-phosphate reductase
MIDIGIVGGTGYTGVELLRLLAQHPEANLRVITSRSEAGMPVAQMFPSLRGRVGIQFTDASNEELKECDVVFFATPHGVAMSQAQALLAAGVKLIDLAADFRIKDAAVFTQWYGMAHSEPELLAESVYGLPEINRDEIARARLVGLPGCYPTAMQLGFAPLLAREKAVVDEGHLIADCKSGMSGAGKKAEIGYLLAETSDNFKAYAIKGHRHHPETVQGLEAIAKRPVGLIFTPHLLPIIRGIHATLYARLLPHELALDVQALYEDFYASSAFVDVMPAGSLPETRSVRGSNYMRIALHRPSGGDTVVILVVEDNLVKGASGQGVQVMNIMFGLPESTGLTQIALSP